MRRVLIHLQGFRNSLSTIQADVSDMDKLKIEFDRDYGCHHKTGWSICVDGSYFAELERFLIVALFKCYWFIIDKEYR